MSRFTPVGTLAVAALALALGACAAAPPPPPAAPPAALPPPAARAPVPAPRAPAPEPVSLSRPAPVPPSPLQTMVAARRDRARELEQAGRLRRALDEWRIALTLDPTDAEAREGRRALEARLERGVAEQLRLGREALARGAPLEARRHFLVVLALDPANRTAFDALQNEVREPQFLAHTVRRGETLATIAERYYGDRSRSEVIWEANQLPPSPRLAVGSTLKIPEIPGVPFLQPEAPPRAAEVAASAPPGEPAKEGPARAGPPRAEPLRAQPSRPDAPAPQAPQAAPAKGEVARAEPPRAEPLRAQPPRPDAPVPQAPQTAPAKGEVARAEPPKDDYAPVNPLLRAAQEALDKGEYAVALVDVERFLVGNANQTDGVDIKKQALYGLGKGQFAQQRYDESYRTLTLLAALAPDYQDAPTLLRQARNWLVQHHYSQGLRLAQEEKLDQAIVEWQKVLDYDPQHANAKRNIDQAERLLRSLQQRQQTPPASPASPTKP